MLKARKTIAALMFAAMCSISFAETVEKPVKPQRPYDPAAPYVLHNGGFSWATVTRIQRKKECSNFVWQDDMLGAFYSVQTGNLPVNFMGKFGVYYPYHYEFRKVQQKPLQVILYSFDLSAGPYWTIPLWEIANLNLAPMIHCRYQLTDEYHHVDLGVGAFVGLEFPIAKKWTVVLNGEVTYDNGNLGSNGKMFPYDHVFSYSADIGFRFDSKGRNKFYYIKNKDELKAAKQKQAVKTEENNKRKEERKAAAEAKKAKKQKENEEYKKQLKEYKEAKEAYYAKVRAERVLDKQKKEEAIKENSKNTDNITPIKNSK
nr:hypothetical protein [uncultured Treponema sp.]